MCPIWVQAEGRGPRSFFWWNNVRLLYITRTCQLLCALNLRSHSRKCSSVGDTHSPVCGLIPGTTNTKKQKKTTKPHRNRDLSMHVTTMCNQHNKQGQLGSFSFFFFFKPCSLPSEFPGCSVQAVSHSTQTAVLTGWPNPVFNLAKAGEFRGLT
jgi:hypothetical protein